MHDARLVAATQADAVRLGGHVGHINEALQVVCLCQVKRVWPPMCGHHSVVGTHWERHACIVPPVCA